MSVSIFLFGSCFGKMDMTAAADKDSAAGAALELVEMSISKVRVEANFMHMVIAADRDGFTTYGRKAMVVGVIAAAKDLRAALNFMNMFLSASAVTVTVAIPITLPITIAVAVTISVTVAVTVTITVAITVTVTIAVARFLLLTLRPAGACHNGLEIHKNALLSA